jgi:hypothetical protein
MACLQRVLLTARRIFSGRSFFGIGRQPLLPFAEPPPPTDHSLPPSAVPALHPRDPSALHIASFNVLAPVYKALTPSSTATAATRRSYESDWPEHWHKRHTGIAQLLSRLDASVVWCVLNHNNCVIADAVFLRVCRCFVYLCRLAHKHFSA